MTSDLFMLLFMLLIILIPTSILINCIYLISYFVKSEKIQKKLKHIDICTIVLGAICNFLLWTFLNFTDYSKPIYVRYDRSPINQHSPLQQSNLLTIIVILLLGYVSYLIIKKKRTSLTPLIYAICLSFILLANILGIVIFIQLSKSIFIFSDLIFTVATIYMMLLPINFFICSINLTRQLNSEYISKVEQREYKKIFLQKINNIIIKSNQWHLIAFVLAIPLLILIIIILTLFGQQPDSVIKAFTETSDWTLSQKISPPPVCDLDAHYLCTVALRGHRNIVKPKRFGMRRGEKIIVNRQLMIANAFEEAIQENFPKAHRLIRCVYDKYGFPLSKLITTQISADIIYFLMKPLEYVFLIFLYLFDLNPENRIARQYIPALTEKYNLKKMEKQFDFILQKDQ